MNQLIKIANKSLLEWEKRRRKSPSTPTMLLGVPVAHGLLAAGEHQRAKRSTGESKRQSEWDRNAFGGIGIASAVGVGYLKHKHNQAKKMYGHLSDEELKKRIENG